MRDLNIRLYSNKFIGLTFFLYMYCSDIWMGIELKALLCEELAFIFLQPHTENIVHVYSTCMWTLQYMLGTRYAQFMKMGFDIWSVAQ